jgi:hypothetical protein
VCSPYKLAPICALKRTKVIKCEKYALPQERKFHEKGGSFVLAVALKKSFIQFNRKVLFTATPRGPMVLEELGPTVCVIRSHKAADFFYLWLL